MEKARKANSGQRAGRLLSIWSLVLVGAVIALLAHTLNYGPLTQIIDQLR